MAHDTSHDPTSACGVGWAVHVPFQSDLDIMDLATCNFNTDKVFDLTIASVQSLLSHSTQKSKKRPRAEDDAATQCTVSVPVSVRMLDGPYNV